MPTPIYDAVADYLGFDPAVPDPSFDLTATLVDWWDSLIDADDD